jgi:hypothetical protein
MLRSFNVRRGLIGVCLGARLAGCGGSSLSAPASIGAVSQSRPAVYYQRRGCIRLHLPAGAPRRQVDRVCLRSGGVRSIPNGADVNNPYGRYGDVAVYTGAQGNPRMYYSTVYGGFGLCGYDTSGNLYLSAPSFQYGDRSQLVRLPADSSNFEQVSLAVKLYNWGASPSVQWDGKDLAASR